MKHMTEWDDEEINYLTQSVRNGISHTEIAKHLNRTQHAVSGKAKKLGILTLKIKKVIPLSKIKNKPEIIDFIFNTLNRRNPSVTAIEKVKMELQFKKPPETILQNILSEILYIRFDTSKHHADLIEAIQRYKAIK